MALMISLLKHVDQKVLLTNLVSFSYFSLSGPLWTKQKTSQILLQICFPTKEASEHDCGIWVSERFKREGVFKPSENCILLILFFLVVMPDEVPVLYVQSVE